MSFLYHRHTKNAIKWIWGIIATIITISMVFVYSGGAALFQQQTAPAQTTQPQATTSTPTQTIPVTATTPVVSASTSAQ